MHCDEMLLHLDTLLDGDGAVAVVLEVEEHLRHCRRCHVVVGTCRETVRVFRNGYAEPLPATLHARVIEALRKQAG